MWKRYYILNLENYWDSSSPHPLFSLAVDAPRGAAFSKTYFPLRYLMPIDHGAKIC